jgi:Zn-dependent peptidase ImmA (M78 family)
MADQKETMGLKRVPVVKMAQRVLNKHGLAIPYDLEALVRLYADLIYEDIPVDGVDGICLNSKTIGKKPKVIVTNNSSHVRQRFTLAHELGHIIIPWHYGTIVENLDAATQPAFNSRYYEQEKEANRFASELLMPLDWIYKKFLENPDSDYLLDEIVYRCDVSEAAAKIRLSNAIHEIVEMEIPEERIFQVYEQSNDLAEAQETLGMETRFLPRVVARRMAETLPYNFAYCVEQNDIVVECGGSKSAHVFHQWAKSIFNNDPYPFYKNRSLCAMDGENTHWWTFDIDIEKVDDPRPWREILENILAETVPVEELGSFRQSVNGKFAGAFSSWKMRKKENDLDEFMRDVVLRFNAARYSVFMAHPEFLILVRKKSEDLLANL